MLLDKYYNTAYHSYSAQSFYPEKRANQVIEAISAESITTICDIWVQAWQKGALKKGKEENRKDYKRIS